jgi:tRNA A-37 threonylcarbamoyl transferase component Bud32
MVDLLLAAPAAPPRWDSLESGGLHCHFRSDIGVAVAEAYGSHAWVYDALREQPDAVLFRGRRPVVGGWLGSTPVVVKRMFHGGLFAKIIGDRFITPSRVRAHSPLSEYLARHGVATAPVVFTSWRRVHGLVRCEVGFELIPDCIDGDRYFFGAAKPPLGWERRAADLGALVARLHSIGFVHGDLNLMNVLFRSDGTIYLLDLDKSAASPAAASTRRCRRNLDRLERSIRKQGREHLPALVEWIVQKVRISYERALLAAHAVFLPELLALAREMPLG